MAYYKSKKQAGVLETIIMSLLKGLWFLISWPFKKILKIKDQKSKIDKIANLEKWMEIEKLLESGDEIHARQAVIEADKFFDSILIMLGSQGKTFADRLRNFENHFNRNIYQSVWNAHKVRNQISHEMDHKLSASEAKSALNNFRKGLENLGAL